MVYTTRKISLCQEGGRTGSTNAAKTIDVKSRMVQVLPEGFKICVNFNIRSKNKESGGHLEKIDGAGDFQLILVKNAGGPDFPVSSIH